MGYWDRQGSLHHHALTGSETHTACYPVSSVDRIGLLQSLSHTFVYSQGEEYVEFYLQFIILLREMVL